MKKQTKLVAVLSTAALLAIGASMTSFAATGWAEEDGTWVYYDRNGDKVTDKWAKSGNNWYYLDSNGEMAVDTLIEDGDNYYYVDINGVMAANQWVAIDNEDAGDDDEPEHYWYYFQANGKALKQGDNSNVALKTINGKKYAFDDEGKMLYGWVDENSAERIDNTDGDAFKEATYYFGGEDDGAMTTGWLLVDVTYDEATNDYEIAPAFNEDEDQSRWFYFKSNGKMIKADNGERTKDKTINGKKYAFDEYGAMVAEWSLDEGDEKIASKSEERAKASVDVATTSEAWNGAGNYAKYTQAWRYFNSVEDGSRVSKGWFKVVAAEMLNKDKYDDDPHVLEKVTVDDLRAFGMIPEFIGRLPIIFTLNGLTEDMLVKILKEPKNAILKQYKKLLALDEVKLEFEDGALHAIARKALERHTGARALRAILEEYMLDIMYEIPKDDNIGEVVITEGYIQGNGGPKILMRGQEIPALEG